MAFNPVPITIEFKEEQAKKAPSCIFVTVSGITIDLKFEPINAHSPID